MPRLSPYLLSLTWVVWSLVACDGPGQYTRLGASASDPGSGGAPSEPPDTGGASGSGTPTGGVTATGGIPASGGNNLPGSGGGGGRPSGGAGGSAGNAGKAGGPGGASGGTAGAAAGGGATGIAGAPGGSSGAGSGGKTATGGTAGASASTGGAAGGNAGAATGGAGGSAGRGGASNGGAGGAGGATQRILSLDFVGGVSMSGTGGVTGTVPMAASETAGVKPARNWNGAPGAAGSLSALVLSDGAPATGASVTWNAPTYASGPGIYALGYSDMAGDVRMLNGYLDPAWGAAPSSPVTVVSFSGLPSTLTAGGYDVYVYVVGSVMGASTRGYNYAIGSKTIRVTQTGPTSTSPASPYPYAAAPDGGAGNYVVFRNVTGAAFNLQVKPDSGGSVFRSPINGLQIVWPSGS